MKYARPSVPMRLPGRSPCGERGLKSACARHTVTCACRSPCGERGLKYLDDFAHLIAILPSLPVRGAWIEMYEVEADCKGEKTSLPVRGAWIEIKMCW